MSETAAPGSFLIVEEYIGRRQYWIRGKYRADALKRWAQLRAAPPPITDEVVKVTAVDAVPYVPGAERKVTSKPAVKRQVEPT